MKVNEIFYSLQGEGFRVGIPAVFVRFSGCNLRCSFCDTDHFSGKEMSEDEIVAEINRYPTANVVITGGEPTFQITAGLLTKLKDAGKYVQIETNGTYEVAPEVLELIDWVTCSPKNDRVVIGRIDEVKVVFKGDGYEPQLEYALRLAESNGAKAMLQPCDVGDVDANREITAKAIEYVKENPVWRLSLQTHKMLDIR